MAKGNNDGARDRKSQVLVSLDSDLRRRLKVFSLAMRKSQSKVVEEALNKHLRRYSIDLTVSKR